jgi:gluconolactonase
MELPMGVIANNPKVYDLVASSVQVEKLATGFAFTEGPIWHPDGYLLFSDMPGDVRRKWTEADGVVEVMRPANKCNGMTLDDDLNLIVCEHWTSHLVRAKLNPDGTEASRETIASHYDGKELNSPNDVVVTSDGSIYFSDPTYGRMEVFGNPREQDLDFQGVYLLPGGSGDPKLLVDDFDQPNGLCLSPDEKTLYVNDSGSLNIRAFDVQADRTLANGRMLVGPEIFEGVLCDGMKCDEHGNIWVTGPGGVLIFDPEGEHLGTVEVPEVVGNFTWGGPSWDVLYVPATTSVYRFQTKVSAARLGYMR